MNTQTAAGGNDGDKNGDADNTTVDLDAVRWNRDDLVAVVAQDVDSRRVLMMAWMNREALRRTVAERQMVYWSRSRQQLWRKGESSGNLQRLIALRLDCDGDTLLAEVEQLGAGTACHTGRVSCFYRTLNDDGRWQNDEREPVLVDPQILYPPSSSGSAS